MAASSLHDGNIAYMEMRPIPDTPHYFASSEGRIFSDHRGRRAPLRPFVERLPSGYARESVVVAGKTQRVHRLVCLTFHGPAPSSDHEVAHLNGDPLDNRASNLRWKTKIENEADKIAHGTSNRGQQHGLAKLTEADVIEIRSCLGSGARQVDLAARFQVSQTTISDIKHRRRWGWL